MKIYIKTDMSAIKCNLLAHVSIFPMSTLDEDERVFEQACVL